MTNTPKAFTLSLRATVPPKADPPLAEKEHGNLRGLLRRFAPRNDSSFNVFVSIWTKS
jgi:hypothetical protein